uniref:Uncharacterized protein n=1 Tax=Glossina palpalis gambiensis TaxID=67801 RepID=A0A1B0BPH2_9MUSC
MQCEATANNKCLAKLIGRKICRNGKGYICCLSLRLNKEQQPGYPCLSRNHKKNYQLYLERIPGGKVSWKPGPHFNQDRQEQQNLLHENLHFRASLLISKQTVQRNPMSIIRFRSAIMAIQKYVNWQKTTSLDCQDANMRKFLLQLSDLAMAARAMVAKM